MARIPELTPEELSPHQYRLAKELGASRGGALSTNGPWGLLLRNAELCERAGHFGTMLRDATSVHKRVSETAILVTARFWNAEFEWWAHASQALGAGVPPAVVDAIRRGVRPVFEKKDEEAAYNYATELHEKKRVSHSTYQALVDQIGPHGAIELTAITGFYTTIAMLLVAFQIDAPAEAGHPFGS